MRRARRGPPARSAPGGAGNRSRRTSTLEERGLPPRRPRGAGRDRQAEVLVGGCGGEAAAQRSSQQSTTDEEGLHDVLDRVRVLLDAHRDRLDTDGVAAERSAEHAEHATVELVEPYRIDAEDVQRGGGDVDIDAPVGAHLRVVTGAAEQPVDDARGPARTPGNHRRTFGVEIDAEQTRGTIGDGDEVIGLVEVEPERDPEAIAKRCAKRAGSRRGGDDREAIEREPERLRAGSLARDKVEG